MQKYLFYFIVYTFSVGQILAQTTFELLFDTTEDQIPQVLLEDNNGNIYCSIKGEQNIKIIKLDQYGYVSDSVEMENEYGECEISSLVYLPDDQIVGLGYYQIDTTFYLWFIKLNTSLEIIKDNKFLSRNISHGPIHSLLGSNGNISMATEFWIQGLYYGICMYEISQNGDTLRSKFFEDKRQRGLNYVTDIIEDTASGCYKVFSFWKFERSCVVTIVDYAFNIIEYSSLSLAIGDHNTASWISNSNYLLTGKYYDLVYQELQLGIVKLSSGDSVIATKYFGKRDTVDWPGMINNMDFIDPNQIYYIGINSLVLPDYFSVLPTTININCLDTNLNLKWQRYYGGDACYIVQAMHATIDGGIVIACSRFDYTNPDSQRNVYILKVDNNGLLMSMVEEPQSKNEVKIFPNPGAEYFNIMLCPGVSSIKLFDINGRQVLKMNADSEFVSVNTHFLFKGLYYIGLFDDNDNLIHVSKWIKGF